MLNVSWAYLGISIRCSLRDSMHWRWLFIFLMLQESGQLTLECYLHLAIPREEIGSDKPYWHELIMPILGSVSGSRGAQGLASPSSVASLPCQVRLYQLHGYTSPHPLHTPRASPISKCRSGQSPLIRLQIPKRDREVIKPCLGSSPRPASSFLPRGGAFPQTPTAWRPVHQKLSPTQWKPGPSNLHHRTVCSPKNQLMGECTGRRKKISARGPGRVQP